MPEPVLGCTARHNDAYYLDCDHTHCALCLVKLTDGSRWCDGCWAFRSVGASIGMLAAALYPLKVKAKWFRDSKPYDDVPMIEKVKAW